MEEEAYEQALREMDILGGLVDHGTLGGVRALLVPHSPSSA